LTDKYQSNYLTPSADLRRIVPRQPDGGFEMQSTEENTPVVAGRDYGTAIVVADRGHVWVGRVSRLADWTDEVQISSARIIRRWGTSKGLNELARGPIAGKTLLDASVPVLAVSARAVIAIIPVEASAWASHLNG
jgi:hypothetical protein